VFVIAQHVLSMCARLSKRRRFWDGNEPTEEEEFLAPPPNMASTPLGDVGEGREKREIKCRKLQAAGKKRGKS